MPNVLSPRDLVFRPDNMDEETSIDEKTVVNSHCYIPYKR